MNPVRVKAAGRTVEGSIKNKTHWGKGENNRLIARSEEVIGWGYNIIGDGRVKASEKDTLVEY